MEDRIEKFCPFEDEHSGVHFRFEWQILSINKACLFLWCLQKLSMRSAVSIHLLSDMVYSKQILETLRFDDYSLIFRFLCSFKMSLKTGWNSKPDSQKTEGLKKEPEEDHNPQLFIREDGFYPNNLILVEMFGILDKSLESKLKKMNAKNVSFDLKKSLYTIMSCYNSIQPKVLAVPNFIVVFVRFYCLYFRNFKASNRASIRSRPCLNSGTILENLIFQSLSVLTFSF